MIAVIRPDDEFRSWREASRTLLSSGVAPEQVFWKHATDRQECLFPEELGTGVETSAVKLPRSFLHIAEIVARHSDSRRWSLLYRVAWRISKGERNLLAIETDDDVQTLSVMRKAVEKDRYRMRAFVRFRKVSHGDEDHYIAWYTPAHRTLDANAEFFTDRFGGMRWSILTPSSSMHWDLQELRYGPGVLRSAAPGEDELEELWRTYYKSIYDPARLNINAMRAQLPVSRWAELPESQAIHELVRQSRGRVYDMRARQPASALEFVPRQTSLTALREAVPNCKACGLCQRATGPVFGEGPDSAKIVIVGEQPGDEEDRSGRPFVGPAGEVLNQALSQAGVDRSLVYLTNAVKAFKFEERGKRRIHQTPRTNEIATCRPWVAAEIECIRPEKILCLGGSAALSVLGRSVRIASERGHSHPHAIASSVSVSYHPSAVLRAPDPSKQEEIFRSLVQDLTGL